MEYACIVSGLTGTALFSLASIPTSDIIGILYINEDCTKIKISFIDFWGRRKDRIINSEEWIPLLDLKSRKTDLVYLTPELTDGSKFKLFFRFGQVLNSTKIGKVLE